MEFQQQSYPIDLLVQRIKTSKIALPDFQRDFVWNPSRVVELLDSVSRQWPIGSLLLLNGPQPFAIRPIDNAPLISDKELDLYVLDGQQRLTSLFHAVADVSDFCYFVDFAALDRDDDEYISWERRSSFHTKYPGVAARANARIALITDIWDLQSFYRWVECLGDAESKGRCVELRDTKLPGLHAKVYKVMAIVLDQTIALEALARIFETLNRTGVALNAFDLMVATLYPTGFYLRDEWEKAQEKYEVLTRISPDELEPVKLIALLARGIYGRKESKGVRQGDLLALNRQRIQELWNDAIELYARALEYCRSNFGVGNHDLVPSWSMILGVAAWLRFKPSDTNGLNQWWMDRLSTQLFSQAANTRIVSEFDLLISHVPGDPVWPVSQPRVAMNFPAKANGVLMRGIGALLVRNGALDLYSGKALAEAQRVVFRSVQPNGAITRVKTGDALDMIVIVTEESDKKLGRSFMITDLPTAGIAAISGQGIDLETGKRAAGFIEHIITEYSAGALS